ncbi:MAG: ABC transporter substrate-binding protein [Hyphomicrobiaceae bacterium]|nr:ABC transporter substrate-binding protein [Hyphomicrobiaceae bacterium]
MGKTIIRWASAAAIAWVAAPAFGLAPAYAESVVRVGMTAGDLPDWTGQPDQGFEGFRFVGWTLHDSFINWDLSRSDREAPLTPGLATKWTIDRANPRRWIFELRKGVKFHDGCDWNADNAIWNIERLTIDKVPQFHPVHFARQRARTNSIEKAEKIDDYTIAIYTKTVESLFPYNMAYWMVISKCAVEGAGNDYKVYAKSPSGTGPYKFDKVVPHERLELVKNSDYWDKNRIPKHDRLVLIPMPEATTRAAALISGGIDFLEAPSPDTIPRLKAAGMNIITLPYPHNWTYQLNFQKGPFADLRVRQAANYAINRAEMVDMLGGVAMECYGVFTPSQAFYGNPIKYAFDTSKATSLLKEANCYPCNVTIGISTSGSGQMQPLPMNELAKAQLEAAGFKVKFEVMDWNTLLASFWAGWEKIPNVDAINVSLSVLDPVSGFLKHFTTSNRGPVGLNWGWYQNRELDQLADEVQASFDPVEQKQILQKMHEMVVADAGRVFIVHDLNPRALSPRLKGFVQAQSWFQDMTPIVVSPSTN